MNVITLKNKVFFFLSVALATVKFVFGILVKKMMMNNLIQKPLWRSNLTELRALISGELNKNVYDITKKVY